MSTIELRPLLWSGVYVPPGEKGRHVDVVEEDGDQVKIVGPDTPPQWVARADVVPDIVFIGWRRR